MKAVLIKPYFDYPSKALPNVDFYKTVDECPDAEVLIGLSANCTVEDLEKMPNLKWIQLLSAGFDTVDLEYLKRRKITLTNCRGIYSIPIAEDVVCKILMSNCNALNYIDNQKNHVWQPMKDRKDLCGQTVGIIGTGSIAVEIAKRLQGFGVNVVGFKRKPASSINYFDEIYHGEDKLDYVLSISDYIVITVDLNDSTYHMINKNNLKCLKEDASIINIARGSIINQKDLTEILESKKIKYAGLDVFENEPLAENDILWDMKNAYITPHASGITLNNKDRVHELIIDNVNRYMKGEPLMNIIIE